MVASALFFAGIVRLDFGNAQAILQVVPFVITLAAAIILKERVQFRQYLTVLGGFVGVVVLIRPATSGFSPWSIVVLLSTVGLVVREFSTRRISAKVPLTSIALATAAGLAIMTAALSLPSGWHRFTPGSALLLLASVVSLMIGYVFAIRTIQVGDLSVSAPFRYSILVGAVAIGYLLFGEVPDLETIVGMAIILATGIYAIHLERIKTDEPVTNLTPDIGAH